MKWVLVSVGVVCVVGKDGWVGRWMNDVPVELHGCVGVLLAGLEERLDVGAVRGHAGVDGGPSLLCGWEGGWVGGWVGWDG